MARRPARDAPYQADPLDWNDHLAFLMCFFIVFLVYTIVYAAIISFMPATDKVAQLIRYGLVTLVQVITILTIQSALDLFMEKGPRGYGAQVKENARRYGLAGGTGGPGTVARDVALLLFCALVPLDAATCAIPGLLSFVASTSIGQFFSGLSLPTFLSIGITWNLITGIKEEFVFRGYLLARLKQKGQPHSAWLVSSLVFGLLHVNFFHFPIYPAGPPIWFASAFLAGLLLAGYVLATGRLLPAILAHGIANTISAVPIWMLHGNGMVLDEGVIAAIWWFYIPQLVAGAILAVVAAPHVRAARLRAKYSIVALAKTTVSNDWAIMIAMAGILGFAGMFGLVAF